MRGEAELREGDATHRDGDDAERKGEATHRDGDDAERKGEAVHRKGDGAERKGEAVRRKGDGAERKGEAVHRKGDGAERKGEAVHRKGDGAERKGERRARLAVLISGSGTNLQALLDACAGGALAAEVVLVVSNRRQAYGLVRAREAGVPTLYFPLKPYRTDGRGRAAYDADLAARVAAVAPDLVVLAGWMHILSPPFLDAFPGRVINLHPALPGQFDGVNAIERTFEAFQRGEVPGGGCMVHVAVPEVDAGPVVAETAVPIYPDDSLVDFARRMHAAEHELIVAATAKMLAGITINSQQSTEND